MSKFLMNHRVLGVVFIAVLALLLWLVSAVFSQKFVSFDNVSLKTSTIGLQLPMKADVKVRGVLVGQVNKIVSDGNKGAVLTLGMKPDAIKQIPANVTASILPKTLFGEKYVELDIPDQPSSSSLKAGDTISQTKIPIEVENVLNDLYPLLRAIQPAELNYTLNALADALDGRGKKIGDSLVTLDGYLKRMNPQLPSLVRDIKLLAQVTDTYADVTPALAETLRNTVKTGNTLHSKEKALNSFLKDMTAFSDTSTSFLNENGDNIIRLGQLGAPILSLLARYSPEYPCMLAGIVRQAGLLADTFRGFIFHIDLRTIPHQPRAYTAADRPVYGASNAPTCAGNPNPPVPYGKGGRLWPNLNDGANNLGKGDGQRTATGFSTRPSASSSTTSHATISSGISATGEQKALVNSLTAPVLGVPASQMSDVATLLFLPTMSGTEVNVVR